MIIRRNCYNPANVCFLSPGELPNGDSNPGTKNPLPGDGDELCDLVLLLLVLLMGTGAEEDGGADTEEDGLGLSAMVRLERRSMQRVCYCARPKFVYAILFAVYRFIARKRPFLSSPRKRSEDLS